MYWPDVGSNGSQGKIRDLLKILTLNIIQNMLYISLTETSLIFVKSSSSRLQYIQFTKIPTVCMGFVRTSRCALRLKSIGWIFKISERQAVNHECGVPAPMSTHIHTHSVGCKDLPDRRSDGISTRNPKPRVCNF